MEKNTKEMFAKFTKAVEKASEYEQKFKAQDTDIAEMKKIVEGLQLAHMKGGEMKGLQAKSKEYKAMMEFIREGKSLEVRNGESMGYLVVPEFYQDIARKLYSENSIRSYATVLTVGSSMESIPIEVGDAEAIWVGETEARGDTKDLTIGLKNMPMQTLWSGTSVSKNLLADAQFGVDSYIAERVARAFRLKEAHDFLFGDGPLKPEGLLNNKDVKKFANGSTSALDADKIIQMKGELPFDSSQDFAYYMNYKTFLAVRTLKTSGSGEYTFVQFLPEKGEFSIDGTPVRILNDMPDIASGAFPIMFGDIKNAYWIGDREDMYFIRDELTKARENKVLFNFTKRTGGCVVQPESVVKLKMSTTV